MNIGELLTFVVAHHEVVVCFLDGPGWREAAAKLLTKGEAWRIAANIAKLPELLGK